MRCQRTSKEDLSRRYRKFSEPQLRSWLALDTPSKCQNRSYTIENSHSSVSNRVRSKPTSLNDGWEGLKIVENFKTPVMLVKRVCGWMASFWGSETNRVRDEGFVDGWQVSGVLKLIESGMRCQRTSEEDLSRRINSDSPSPTRQGFVTKAGLHVFCSENRLRLFNSDTLNNYIGKLPNSWTPQHLGFLLSNQFDISHVPATEDLNNFLLLFISLPGSSDAAIQAALHALLNNTLSPVQLYNILNFGCEVGRIVPRFGEHFSKKLQLEIASDGQKCANTSSTLGLNSSKNDRPKAFRQTDLSR
ncbi:hypothetical protein U1Q18_050450 [Sarracenia purpurea var. burkii]